LEEVADADLLLHVVDGSHPDPAAQLAAVREVLGEIDALGVPEIVVVNKADIADPAFMRRLQISEPTALAVSARSGAGLDELRTRIAAQLPRPEIELALLVPYDRGDVVSRLHQHADVRSVEHDADGTHIEARVPGWMLGELADFHPAASRA
jgi:GTP-binding protein HflX